jgi:nitroimidazol reductase NimA-like FMN-containing flavoprotein (pyridoxamine 5'-phosphate oxidase superfamily)
MRHADREVKEILKIVEILNRSNVLRIAINDQYFPYIIPIHFSYFINENFSIIFYMHSSSIGKKIELISKNNHIGFETDIFYRFANQESTIPCQWSTIYESVIGDGYVEIITDEKEKKFGLDSIMRRFGKGKAFEPYLNTALQKVVILKLIVENISGKRHIQ